MNTTQNLTLLRVFDNGKIILKIKIGLYLPEDDHEKVIDVFDYV